MRELKWQAPEFHYHEKDVSWYWMVIIGALILLAIAAWQGNFLFGFFIILSAFLLIEWGKKVPKTLIFSLNERGFGIDDKKFYEYQKIKAFAIGDDRWDEDFSELVLEIKNHLMQHIKVPIFREDKEMFREFLMEHLPETQYEESLIDHFLRFLKF